MKNKTPSALLMVQDQEWRPALERLLGDLGIRVDRVHSIRQFRERWMEELPDWVLISPDIARDLATHFSPLGRRRRSNPSILIVSEELLDDLGEVERKLAQFSSSVRTVSPVEIVDVMSRNLRARIPGAAPSQEEPATILCVDDDPLYLNALTRHLSRHGYRVLTSASAPQAIETAVRSRPDLAIVDVLMPDMDGLELTECLSRMSSGPLPVVLLTGLESEQTAIEGFRRGARYLLRKSDDPGKVLEVVDYFVGDLEEPERQALKERL